MNRRSAFEYDPVSLLQLPEQGDEPGLSEFREEVLPDIGGDLWILGSFSGLGNVVELGQDVPTER